MNDPQKIKYNSYMARFKVCVILYAEKHGNLAAEREFSVFLKLTCDRLTAVTDAATSEESEHVSVISDHDGDL